MCFLSQPYGQNEYISIKCSLDQGHHGKEITSLGYRLSQCYKWIIEILILYHDVPHQKKNMTKAFGTFMKRIFKSIPSFYSSWPSIRIKARIRLLLSSKPSSPINRRYTTTKRRWKKGEDLQLMVSFRVPHGILKGVS